MKTVISIGEALIDFIPKEIGIPLKDVTAFIKKAGGAPANVAAAASKLGGNAAYIGKLGNDAFGDYLIETLIKAGVSVDYVQRTDAANTSLAFVSLKADGNRDFSFYRNPGADMLLSTDELHKEWFEDCILHFCSVDLVECPAKYAHKIAIEYTRQNSGIISFDPNLRFPLWDDKYKLKETVLEFLPYCDIVKLSDEETEFVTGFINPNKAAEFIFSFGVKMVIVTKGAQGATLYMSHVKQDFSGFKTDAVDTTGAGDAFMGGFLYFIASRNLKLNEINNPYSDLSRELIEFASATAAYSVERYGAIDSFPILENVVEIIDNINRRKG